MSMSNNNTEKLGGPYTKTEQEQRREQVYQMHFEKGMSAVKIADKLKVNRNTVNDDIKYWNVQTGAKFGKENIGATIASEIEMIGAIRQRLLENYENLDFAAKLNVEKMLLDAGYKIANIVTKMIPLEKVHESEISPEMFASVVKQLCHCDEIRFPSHVRLRAIKKEIVVNTSRDFNFVNDFVTMMFEEGLGIFESRTRIPEFEPDKKFYDVTSFAVAKKIITSQEKREIFEKKEHSPEECTAVFLTMELE